MNAYLYPGLELAPKAVQHLVDAIPRERYDERTDPERFTLREAVAHLSDWEPIMLHRMQRALEEEGAEVFGIDEGDRAIEMRYENTDVQAEAARFIALRADTIAWLRSLGPEDWAKTIHHNEKGKMTVYDQANMLLGHDIYHLEHLAQFLKPVERVVSTW